MVRSKKEFDYIKIKLASPMRILEWSHRKLPNGQFVGEVQKSETINYRTFKPEMDGLFCERIFGPSKSLECACGKYKRVRYEGLICERCGVELTESRVRRHRMGHINLIYPVTHVWYTNSRPNYIALLLEVEQCEKRLDTGWTEFADVRDTKEKDNTDIPDYFSLDINNYLTSPKILLNCKKFLKEKSKAKKSNIVNFYDERIKRIKLASLAYFIAEDEIAFYGLHWDLQQYRRCRELGFTGYPLKPYAKSHNRRRNTPKYLLRSTPNYLIGAVLIKRELEKLNLDQEIIKTRNFIMLCSKVLHQEQPFYNFSHWSKKWEYQRIYKLRDQSIKRIRILENLLTTGANPAWMIITILPVIPPALRPMIQLEGGRFATSDLNELYRRIITRNNRLLRLLEIDAPQLIIRNEKRMLQEAVDTLIDNGKRGKIALSASNRPLKSLSDIIKGKHGRFRQNLLGKRVDYSGRSVIVVGPSLQLHECGLPREMALELFQPFIIQKLLESKLTRTVRGAKLIIYYRIPIIWQLLLETLQSRLVFLNRAPSLHRLSVQAFVPILIGGKAIRLHPLVCPPFNADFDGDQMAVHVPLAKSSQLEARTILLSTLNLVSPANGQPITAPSQDMVLGFYYLTLHPTTEYYNLNHEPIFGNLSEALTWICKRMPAPHKIIWVRTRVNMVIPNFKNHIYYACMLPYGNKATLTTSGKHNFDSHSEKMNSYYRISVGRLLFSIQLAWCALSNRPDF